MVIFMRSCGQGNHRRTVSPHRAVFADARGHVTLDNLHVLNAILYVAEQGCNWRGLPKRFGNWQTSSLVSG